MVMDSFIIFFFLILNVYQKVNHKLLVLLNVGVKMYWFILQWADLF